MSRHPIWREPTVNGSNDQRLQQYEYMTRKQLEEQLLPSVPEVKPGDWQAGWFVGTGCLIPTGGISDLFNYAWLFNIGLSGGYKNLILKADISYGQPDIHNFTDYNFNPFNKTTAEGNRYQSLNKYTKLLSGSVSLGYRVIDVKRFAITPHIGGGWTNYAWNSGEFKEFEENGETVWKLVTESQKESFHRLQFHGRHRLRLAFPHHSKRQVVILVGTSRAIHVVGPPDAICNLLQLRIAQSGNKRRALWNQSDIQRIHKGSTNQLTAQQKAGVRSCLLFYFSGNRLLSFLSTTANAVTTIRPVSTHDIG